ncbi:MAG TPA: hypothetical protein VEV87_04355 [Chitinophagaceae bacterium]|nr:hypothetical protein [Chitinophagaceae bacterium]
MEVFDAISRRVAVKSSLFGLMAVYIPNILFAKKIEDIENDKVSDKVGARYPSIEDSIVSEVVGVSHFNLDRLKELVDPRPELSRASWDWAFADWETAIGAASHVGRRDIVQYLISKGARPDIFTFAMLGSYSVVKSTIELYPGIQRTAGPHGISLLQHVKNGVSENKSVNTEAPKLIDYLEALGDADSPKYIDQDEAAKQKFIGDYKYGDGGADGFTIKVNSRKFISLGRLGKNGGSLYKVGDNKYMYNGAPSTIVSFSEENGKVISLTITEPGLSVVAKKV